MTRWSGIRIVLLCFTATLNAQFTPIRIACGSTIPFIDSGGNTWAADSNFSLSAGTYYANHAIANTAADQALYQRERNGKAGFQYLFSVPPGSYQIHLGFSENLYNAPAKRIFNVALNNSPTLENFDIVATAGSSYTGVDKYFPLTTTGQVLIQFYPLVGNGKIDLIEILPLTVQTGLVNVSMNGGLGLAINSSIVLTRSLGVQNADHYCADSSGTVSGTCLTPTPAAWAPGYFAGEWVDYIPSMSSSGAASLNVNSMGVMSIKLSDGTTDPGPLLVAGRSYRLTIIPVGPQPTLVWSMSQGDSHQ